MQNVIPLDQEEDYGDKYLQTNSTQTCKCRKGACISEFLSKTAACLWHVDVEALQIFARVCAPLRENSTTPSVDNAAYNYAILKHLSSKGVNVKPC